MKHLLLLIILLFPLSGKAQIDIQIDYNQKNKRVSVVLKNEVDDAFVLGPPPESYADTARYSAIRFTLRDKQNRFLKKGSQIIYHAPLIKVNGQKANISRGRILTRYDISEYIYWLTDEYFENKNNYTLEVEVQLKAYAAIEKKMYLIDKKQTFLW